MNMEGVTGVLFIIFFFGMPVFIVGIISYFRSRDRAELQKTMRAAIEKGQSLPPEFIEGLQRRQPRPKTPMNDVRAGIVLIAVAAGIMIWNYLDHGFIGGKLSGLAAVPGLIGLALLILGIIGLNSRKS